MENIAGGGTVLDETRERPASAAGGRDPSVRSYQVYLAPAGESPLRGPLGWLARRYGLDVYGGSLLSRRAAIEMGFAALMLTVIVSFDLGAWTLLFNAIFHSTGDMLDVTWVSLLALAAGLLLAGAVFIYERQFVTADTSVNRVGLVAAFLVRVTIVVIAAAITAQPVELLIFRGPIERRIHEEGIAAELVARQTEILEQKEKVKGQEEKLQNINRFLKDEIEAESKARTSLANAEAQRASVEGQIAEAQATAAAARGDAKREEGEMKAAQDRKRRWANELEGLRQRGEDTSTAEENYRAAVKDEDAARRAMNNALGRQSRNEALAQSLTGQRSAAEGRVAAEQTNLKDATAHKEGRQEEVEISLQGGKKLAENEIQELRNYIDLVRKDGRTKPVQWPPDAKVPRFKYKVQSYDFFEQLRVLQDLREARWAKWPVDKVTQKNLAGQYGLEWHDTNDERLQAEAEFYDRSYWVTFGIAFVIPMLMLAVKLLMTRELSAYFSSEYQARNGNPDALLLNRTRDELRERSWWWGRWRQVMRRRSVPTAAALPSAPEAL